MTNTRDGDAPIEIEGWLNGKPSWLRAAAHGLLHERRMPTEGEISALADHCVLEATERLDPLSDPLAAGSIMGTPGRAGLRLERLFNIRGVNALGEQSKLELSGVDLGIIYGPNGSGKSGYARLVKHLCGARRAGNMHGDVFKRAHESPSASVELRTLDSSGVANSSTVLRWEASAGPLMQLQAVPVFDTDTSVEFGDSETSATHAPRSMKFVSCLIEISDAVRAELRRRIDLLVSQLPSVPTDLVHSHSANALRMILDVKPGAATIDTTCGMPETEREERVALEAALAKANPAELLKRVVGEQGRLAALRASTLGRGTALGDENATLVIAAGVDAKTKREAATTHATAFFQGVPLPGVGEGVWRQLWAAAEAYSNALAYPDHRHPNTDDGAKCVLCQQDLEEGGRARMRGFADFVQGTLQAEASAAEAHFRALLSAIPAIPDQQSWASLSQAIGLDSEKGELLRGALVARAAALATVSDVAGLPKVDWSEWHAAETTKASDLERDQQQLAQLIDEDGRKRNQNRLIDLRGKEWLASQVGAVHLEVARLREVDLIEAAVKLCWTGALTSKNNEIASAELAQGFCDRFNDEMSRLGGRALPVVMTHRSPGKGRITFSAELVNPLKAIHNREVLSEGERRVIALAAFLADAGGSDRSIPVVFDDPISSLDQRFEEAVAARIVELAETRQVIVFTHRLSLMALLQAAHERREANGSEATCKVIAIGRDGHQTGVPAPVDTFSLKPLKGLGQLISDLGAAKKKEPADRRAAVKDACSTFRILLERTVENHLCANIVGRFRREIHTKNLLKKLVAVEPSDCELIDGLMTKYSAFEHSQPEEAPTHLPDPDEIIEDAQTLRAWIEDFERRAKCAAEGKAAA